jgi:hypothetical protein
LEEESKTRKVEEPEKYEGGETSRMEFKSKHKFNSIVMQYNETVFSGMRGRVLYFKSDSKRFNEQFNGYNFTNL